MLGHLATKIFSAGFHLEPRAPEITTLLNILLRTERYVSSQTAREDLVNHCILVSSVSQSVDRHYSGPASKYQTTTRAQTGNSFLVCSAS